MVCGAAAAAALLLLANRGVVASVTTRIVDDTYARLRPHPRVIEPVAGDVAGVATQVASPQAVEPRAGAVAPQGGRGSASPGAPSDAEVRRELAQVQREQRAAKVAPAFQNPVGVGPVAPFQPAAGWHTSVASVYTDYGKPIACGGVLAPNQLGVAHKTAPCGALRHGRVLFSGISSNHRERPAGRQAREAIRGKQSEFVGPCDQSRRHRNST